MTLKVAVIGVGSMGRNHARIYAEISEVDLVGVADNQVDTAARIANQFGTSPYKDFRQMLDEQKPDAVSIAVPTSQHLSVALQCIERGVHLLIEKPIADSLESGKRILHAAEQANVKLMIGHVERFNPAVALLKEHLGKGDLGAIYQIDARRQGPFPTHVKDVGVAVDLAVHDIDIMNYIVGAPVNTVFAETAQHIHRTNEDMLCGLIRFANSVVGTLTINWLTPTKIRELIVTGERGMYRVDYLTQDLYFFENAEAGHQTWDSLAIIRGVNEGRMIGFVVAKREPLKAELESFLQAVRDNSSVAVTGADGIEALRVAQALRDSGARQAVINIADESRQSS